MRTAAVPRRVWGGTGLLVLGRLWGSACTLGYLFLAARHLTGDGFGRLTFYLALFMVLDALADLGTGQATVQRTADDPAALAGVLRSARRVRFAAGLVGVVVVGGGAFATHEPGAGWILLASLYPVTHVLELSSVVFKNEIAWSRPVLVRAAASTSSLAFVAGAVALGIGEPAPLLFAIAAGSTLGNVMLHASARSRLPAREPAAPLGPLLRAALPIGVAGLCQQTYFYVDNLFVRPLEGEVALGRYNLAVRVMSYGIMVAVYAPLAALPWLTREHAAGRLGPATARLAQPLFALAGLGTGALWPWRGAVLGLFGPGFDRAAGALAWLLVACLAVHLGASFLTAVVATGRSLSVLWIAVAGLAVNVAGNAWLVPREGIEGAAAATLGTEVAVAALAVAVLVRAGANPFGRRSWAWIGGPALFLLARALSSMLPFGVPA